MERRLSSVFQRDILPASELKNGRFCNIFFMYCHTNRSVTKGLDL